MKEADAIDHDVDPEVVPGWGICGVFAVVSVGYLWGICGYLGVFAPRPYSSREFIEHGNWRFPLACAADSAIRQPRLTRQERQENRDDQTSNIILNHE